MKPTVFILSNQTLYAEALKSLLKEEDQTAEITIFSIKNPEINVRISTQQPDLVLLDANDMGKPMWNLLNAIAAQSPNSRIIMLANSNEVIYREYAIKYGAMGYVLKSSPRELLTAAMKIVMKGGYFFDPGIQGIESKSTNAKLQSEYKLSKREIEVVQLIKDGYSSKAIADHLGVSFHTIEAHRKNIYNKLNIRKVTELLKVFRKFDS